MPDYYLRVEAVNIANYVQDTKDLRTIRGGGLLLLDLVEKLPTKHHQLEPVTTGASSGLFQFKADGPVEAGSLRDQVERDLRHDPCLQHATFVVDFIAANDAFVRDREQLIALNRWRQMRQPTVAVPTRNATRTVFVCELDRLRPAPPESKPYSASVKRRRDFGQKEKQEFYKSLTGVLGEYTQDFDDLTALGKTGAQWDAVPRNLDNKMAVIYVDGNKFGAIQDDVAQSADAQSEFDEQLKKNRKGLLKAILEDMTPDSTWKTDACKNRIETLLWGGDEVIWVVPAWKGWDLLTRFYELTAQWKAVQNSDPQHRLTHAAGLVFCHHNAPIHRITALAHDLAERAKKGGPRANLFGYVVLESFDHIGEGIDEYLEKRRPRGFDSEQAQREWILPGGSMNDIRTAILGLKNAFPRRKLFQVVREFLVDRQKARDVLDGALQADEAAKKCADGLLQTCGNSEMAWFHAAELWDYVLPAPSKKEAN